MKNLDGDIADPQTCSDADDDVVTIASVIESVVHQRHVGKGAVPGWCEDFRDARA